MSDLTLPKHIAIIMDGNGRWAKERHLPRVAGHRAGVESVREITEECARKKIEQLTLYAFSRDNWKRPQSEVGILMKFLRRFLISERKRIMDNDIILKTIGEVTALPDEVQEEMAKTREMSASNTGMVLCLALNYGARHEIVDAAKRLAEKAAAGEVKADDIDIEMFRTHLSTAGMSDPDLLIRTAGEIRLSDFLLFQLSYAEFYFTPMYWPDFRIDALNEAIEAYSNRVRKFGALKDS
jgi:undecaprenyl diphosphate synthase